MDRVGGEIENKIEVNILVFFGIDIALHLSLFFFIYFIAFE